MTSIMPIPFAISIQSRCRVFICTLCYSCINITEFACIVQGLAIFIKSRFSACIIKSPVTEVTELFMGRVVGLEFCSTRADISCASLVVNTALATSAFRSATAYAKSAEPHLQNFVLCGFSPTCIIKSPATEVTELFMGRVVGVEPTHIGTTIRGLNHLAIPAIY